MIDHLLLQLDSLTPQCTIQLESGLCLTLEESFEQRSAVQLGTHLKPTGEMGVVVGTLGLLALALPRAPLFFLLGLEGPASLEAGSWLALL